MKIQYIVISFCVAILLLAAGCTISYKLNAAAIDYNVVKSITIRDFPNQAPLVYPPLSQVLTEQMKDLYIRKTRLQMAPNNGDLELEGEIIGYDLTPMAVKEDAYESRTKLTVSVRVRYTNNQKSEDDFEQTFSAYQDFDANQMLDLVQEDLCKKIVEEICDQVFNATVAKW